MVNRLLVTGGSGFIGSAFIRNHLKKCTKIVNLDLLTYAADPSRLKTIENDTRYRFIQGDICNQELVSQIILQEQIDTVVHFAAESHVDRSIAGPQDFLKTNVLGTFALLEVLKKFPTLYFHHVSTDEVYGSLGDKGLFHEASPYLPNSPYAASKAASDHFVRAYAHTYGLRTTISHCSNNYGPFQHPEKLVPLIIHHCLEKKSIPIYGTGKNIRDWIHIDDHVEAIWLILTKGKKGEVYDIGGETEMRNIDLVHAIMEELTLITDETYESLITYVTDRPGHDYRYAINASKIKKELGWVPSRSLKEGLSETIRWTLESLFSYT
jgi:dTDP-glucose 4,6-dehydratase